MTATEDRLGEAYRDCAAALYATALRLLRSPEEAEDAVHDAFLRFHRQGPEFAPERPGAWLHRVVVNTSLDRLRARSRWGQEEWSEDLAAPLPPPSIGSRLDLERAVGALPEGARRVFVLHDVEGFLHSEIASLLGISAGTSKSQLFRARELLRSALESPAATRGAGSPV